MESRINERMRFSNSHRGIALVTVLFVTGIGLLLGAGALLLFRMQCQLRIERQHEVEKVYAVRSALNWIEKNTDSQELPASGRIFNNPTGSGRNLSLIVRPVKQIFPETDKTKESYNKHLDIYNEERDLSRMFNTGKADNYSLLPDFEYGAIDASNADDLIKHLSYYEPGEFDDVLVYKIDFVGTNLVRWVNIGMDDTQGWLQEEYGRRYSFRPIDFGAGNSTGIVGDEMRICLIRGDVFHQGSSAGFRHGWPLANDERAVVFRICKDSSSQYRMSVQEWICGSVATNKITKIETSASDVAYMGFQLARDRVSLFSIDLDQQGPKSGLGYDIISGTNNLSATTIKYFLKGAIVKYENGSEVPYDGNSDLSDNMKIMRTPDLRAVIEVDPYSAEENSFTEFKVTPAYQYDVILRHPEAGITNALATVAQKSGKTTKIWGSESLGSSANILTYDTHGTEHKGFRQDEREAERRALAGGGGVKGTTDR